MCYGSAAHMSGKEFEVTVNKTWFSPVSGATYPVGWRIRIPERNVDVVLTALLETSEFDATRYAQRYYWEGEVTISGSHSGKGFVELTGY